MNILEIDQKALVALNNYFVGKNYYLDKLVEFFGVYLVYSLPIILILMWFLIKKEQKAIAFSFVGTIFSWFVITKNIVPLIWFRPRPDLAMIGAREVFFERPSYSFPSDHATALFAITFGFYLFGYKKAGNYFLIYTLLIVFARVTAGVHFPLDIVGGAISALIGTLIIKAFEQPLQKSVYSPLVKFLKKYKLA